MSKEELEKKVINKEGKVNLDASFKDFLNYVGCKYMGYEKGFMTRTYHSLYELTETIKIKDLDKFREEGIGRSPLATLRQFGKKGAEDLNRVLSRYGIKPIPWLTKKYKAWELVKKYKVKSGLDLFDAIGKI